MDIVKGISVISLFQGQAVFHSPSPLMTASTRLACEEEKTDHKSKIINHCIVVSSQKTGHRFFFNLQEVGHYIQRSLHSNGQFNYP
jgi:hypothetical protein